MQEGAGSWAGGGDGGVQASSKAIFETDLQESVHYLQLFQPYKYQKETTMAIKHTVMND